MNRLLLNEKFSMRDEKSRLRSIQLIRLLREQTKKDDGWIASPVRPFVVNFVLSKVVVSFKDSMLCFTSVIFVLSHVAGRGRHGRSFLFS